MSIETTDGTAANLATVQHIYKSFGRGDIPSILDAIADDCRWESWSANSAQAAGVSYLQPRIGPAGVGEFFASVAALEIHDFQVLGFLTGEDTVAVEIMIEASYPDGGRFRDEELHLWTLGANGMVTRMRHYVDTAKHIAAAEGKDTTA